MCDSAHPHQHGHAHGHGHVQAHAHRTRTRTTGAAASGLVVAGKGGSRQDEPDCPHRSPAVAARPSGAGPRRRPADEPAYALGLPVTRHSPLAVFSIR